MDTNDNVCHDVAQWSCDGNTSLSESGVYPCVGEGCCAVSHKRCQKDEGDDGVIEAVIFLKVGNQSLAFMSVLVLKLRYWIRTPIDASFIPATMNDQKQEPSRGTLLRGLFQLCVVDCAVTGGGTSFLISSSSSEEESLCFVVLATRLESSRSDLPGVFRLSSILSGELLSG